MVMKPRHTSRIILIVQAVLAALWLTGCRIPELSCLTCRRIVDERCANHIIWPTDGAAADRADRFLTIAKSLSDTNDSRSVDYYFQAAAISWKTLSERSEFATPHHQSWDTYQTSLQGLVSDALRFGRLDDCGNLNIYQPDGPLRIPLTSTSLDWPMEQLGKWLIPSPPSQRVLKNYFQSKGLGVPLVIFRDKPEDAQGDPAERYFPKQLPLATTAILRSVNDESSDSFELELVNPLRANSIQIQSHFIPIAKDLSAPLDFQLRNRPTNPLLGFVSPGIGNQNDGMRWMEPYQHGKIPIVFIHGLMSDPTTWLDMLNELRTIPWFNERYQVWGFGYATGSPFVTSAMRLREQCREAIWLADPQGEDPALRQMVLIGHSMGGLLAKLQITDSQDRLWNSISSVPWTRIRATSETKRELEKRLFFTPQSHVKRVVYIATPHQGSSIASRGTGRIFSSLVHPDDNVQSFHERLIRDNPTAFYGTFRNRIPTSIDLLEPSDASLQSIYGLHVPDEVQQHSIIGTGDGPWTLGLNDGVVPVSSARHPSAISELKVKASHTKILKNSETISEVIRLLHVHLMEAESQNWP